jgi:ATP-dependent DNA helicase RecG
MIEYVRNLIQQGEGMPEPVYDATQGGMAGTVFQESVDTQKSLVESETKEVNEGVNEGVNILRAIITQHPGLRAPSLAEKMQTSVKNIERWLKRLKETKEIEFRGSPKTGGYFATAKANPAE